MAQAMTNSTEINEQRRFNRISFDAEAQLIKGEEKWPCHLIDLSLKGALIAHPENLETQTGNKFLLRLVLDSEREIVIEMQVSVSHIENNHIGFCCEHIDLGSVTHLRRLVELNLGDAKLLDRNLSALGK